MLHADANVGDVVYVTTEKITADKCIVVDYFAQYPKRVIVQSFNTNKQYIIYPDLHCYNTEDDAKLAAEQYKSGRENKIY